MTRMLKIFSFVCLVSFPIIETRHHRRAILKTHPHQRKNNYHEGRNAREGEYPYVIVLVIFEEDMFERLCTGSMISDNWGITAAHCLEIVPHAFVHYGNFTKSPFETGSYVPVIEMFTHPSYQSTTNINDIGMFRSLSVPKKPHAVLLSTDYTKLLFRPVVYVGASMTKWDLDVVADTRPLQLGEATIKNCVEELKTNPVICIAPKNSNKLLTTWSGDSGGPLIYDGKVVGVASFVIGDKIQSPAYIPVSPFISWIQHVMDTTRV